MLTPKQILIAVSTCLILAACADGDHNTNDNNNSSGTDPIGSTTSLTYANVNARVFQPRCFRCHAGAATDAEGIQLDSYEKVLARIDDVRFEISGRHMPPDISIPQAEIDLVVNWIDAGAPQ